MTKAEYNEVPVHWCTNCGSLAIKELENLELNYCAKCGNTDIDIGHIDKWEEYQEKLEKQKQLFSD